MAREILRFGKLGWITRVDGKCYSVRINDQHTAIVETKRVTGGFFNTPTCSTDMVNAALALQLAGASNSFPGWTKMATLRTDADGAPTVVTLQDRFYGNKYWLAQRTTEFGWKATRIGGIVELGRVMAQYANTTTAIKVGPPPEAQQETAPFFENISPVLVLGIALVLVGIIITAK